MHPSLAPLAAIFDLNTDLLINCLDGVSDDDARRRLEGGGNSLAFLAAHLTDTRHFIAGRLGRPLPNPLAPLLAEARTIEDIQVWPPLERIRDAWLSVSDHLASLLAALTADELARENVHRFPLADTTALGFLAFLAQHDSYHVGQAAFLRRQIGREPMAYTRGSSRRGSTPAG
jgi:uncharacterized damage-inducible protein DinB